MPFYVVQFQPVGHRALIAHKEDPSLTSWPDFASASQRAVESSGWDGECRVFHFASDGMAREFASKVD